LQLSNVPWIGGVRRHRADSFSLSGYRARHLRWSGLMFVVRARSEPVLMGSLFLAWIAFVALLSAIPMYADAANQFVLGQELASEGGRKPPYALYFLYVGTAQESPSWTNYAALRRYLDDHLEQQLGIPRQLAMHYAASDRFQLHIDGSAREGSPLYASLGFIEDIEQHIVVHEGRFPEVQTPSAETLDVLVSESLTERMGLQVGEELILFRPGTGALPVDAQQRSGAAVPAPDEVAASAGTGRASNETGTRIQLNARVAGVWSAADPDSVFWYISPSAFERSLLLPQETFLRLAEAESIPHLLHTLGFYQVFDGTGVRAENVQQFVRRVRAAETRAQILMPGISMGLAPISAMLRYQRAASSQTLQLVGFLVPFMLIILYFIVMVSGHLIERQRLEIAVLKSRGASSAQILELYVFQACLMGLVALLCGPVLGRLAVGRIGVVYGFLEFGQSRMSVAITRTSTLYAMLGVAVAAMATVLPALRASRYTIVEASRQHARQTKVPTWQRVGLDLMLLFAAAYAYHLLRAQGRIAILSPGSQTSPLANPLLFLAPALFLLAGSLISLRLVPTITKAIASLLGWTNNVPALLAFQSFSRAQRGLTGLLLMLALGTSLAAFSASAAKTIDYNMMSRIRYRVGADVVLREGAGVVLSSDELEDTGTGAEQSASTARGWAVLPVEQHLKAPGVYAASRVARVPVRVAAGDNLLEGTFYGVDRTTFPQVAYFRPDFSPQSLGHLMNRLATVPSGIIVSRRLLARTGMHVGDVLPLQGLVPLRTDRVLFEIVGVASYFPTAYPDEGEWFIGNLSYVYDQTGVHLPYDVWLSVADEMDISELLDELEPLGIRVLSHDDARALAQAARTTPERTGVFGFLSLGFLLLLGLCILSQIVYTLVSFRRRSLQLGMLRAIGLSRPQLVSSMTLEMLAIYTIGISLGIGLGIAATWLFVPFLQIGYRQMDLVPPFEMVVAWREVALLTASLAMTFLLTNAGVVLLLARTRITDALRLGQAPA